MKILVTNDDGIDAPGIKALAEVARQFGDVCVIAPDSPQSGISHRITFDAPLPVKQIDPSHYAVGGTPADCIRWAIGCLKQPFDLVLSGINNGANLGADVFVSGTVAAVREAVLQNVPAIGLSQHRLNFPDPDFDWNKSITMAQAVLPDLIQRVTGKKETVSFQQNALNVNFPDSNDPDFPTTNFPPRQECQLDFSTLPTSFREMPGQVFLPDGIYNERNRIEGGDIERCFSGMITVTGIGCT